MRYVSVVCYTQVELDERLAETTSLQELNKRLASELSSANEMLRKEQDRCALVDKQRSNLEVQIKDLEYRLEETELSATKNSRKVAQKLEQRISDLEQVVEAEQRRTEEATKLVKKQEKRIKELLSQADEEQKIKLQIQENCDQMQLKMKAFKRQVEDAVSSLCICRT
jgi:chromosome segregation ATPase